MKFKIHNESDYIINGFYTVDDGRTSDNWMDFKLSRGETGNMEFEFDGSCEIEFIVGWEAEDGSTIKGDNTTIDICKANNIYFDGDNATYDWLTQAAMFESKGRPGEGSAFLFQGWKSVADNRAAAIVGKYHPVMAMVTATLDHHSAGAAGDDAGTTQTGARSLLKGKAIGAHGATVIAIIAMAAVVIVVTRTGDFNPDAEIVRRSGCRNGWHGAETDESCKCCLGENAEHESFLLLGPDSVFLLK
jgi:hypothetical protein